MDIDKLERAKEIQQCLRLLRKYIEGFPHLGAFDFIAEILDRDYEDYKENALRTLNKEIALLEQEFKQL